MGHKYAKDGHEEKRCAAYILVRWKDCVKDREEWAERAAALFCRAKEIPGVRRAPVSRACIQAENRCGLMICLDMERRALAGFDASSLHSEWKREFGPQIAQKVIFDCEGPERAQQ